MKSVIEKNFPQTWLLTLGITLNREKQGAPLELRRYRAYFYKHGAPPEQGGSIEVSGHH